MFITIDYDQVQVPDEILMWCDVFTYDAKRDDLRYLDCVYMNMGEYGNDLHELEKMRIELHKWKQEIMELDVMPVFE